MKVSFISKISTKMFLRNVSRYVSREMYTKISGMGSLNFELDRKESGRIGEEMASIFLHKKGYKVIARNFRKPWGEIDIIAERNNVVRFVEVKTLSRYGKGDVSREKSDYLPEEQVHASKLRKISRTAELYMHSMKDRREFQIDVVGVFLDREKRIATCRLFEQVL